MFKPGKGLIKGAGDNWVNIDGGQAQNACLVCVSAQFRCTIQDSIFLNEELSLSACVL